MASVDPDHLTYRLELRCTKCGLRKVVEDFPIQGQFRLGEVLTAMHIAVYEKGCLRCGTCAFEVMSAPSLPPLPEPPVGWVRRPT